ncbi:type VI secretion system baseplate subunit TssE [Pusillimonas sp. T7-7]|uniref:type VI secretion system baseplate subunit TssE n=1 Tax=Pusillimonas sp. (strain T7-7) TaxID=1007105 RepID=UPI000674176A|nr:type VI secretion system baseplate subunit TssE [Pusillimonas sp. T7-7]
MSECRLLEHISNLGAEEGWVRQHSRSEVLVNSILEHLRRILNTRQGSVPVDPEFGVPDFTNLAGSFSTGTTDQIVQDMSRMIQRYEPRLRQAQVTFAANRDEVLSLAFSIAGTVNVDDREIPVRLTSQVAANGRVSLRRQ